MLYYDRPTRLDPAAEDAIIASVRALLPTPFRSPRPAETGPANRREIAIPNCLDRGYNHLSSFCQTRPAPAPPQRAGIMHVYRPQWLVLAASCLLWLGTAPYAAGAGDGDESGPGDVPRPC